MTAPASSPRPSPLSSPRPPPRSLPARAVAHVRALWPGAGVLLPLPFVLWLGFCLSQGEVRWELAVVTSAVVALAWGNAKTKELFLGVYPMALLGLVYESMRFWKFAGMTAERVHLCDLRAIDLRFVSVDLGDGVRGTAHDWFLLHPSRALDVLCAVPYGTFIYAAIALVVFLYRRDRAAMRAFGWTFFFLNLAGFATYHIYPAAPPWYFHAHGCAVDLASRASEGPALGRVDAMLGFGYFRGFYGRSNDVFGAVPSLHVAYPLLILLYGYRHFGVVTRVLAVAYFATMCFAAVYLDHHWVVDVLLGLTYTITVSQLVRIVMASVVRASLRRRAARHGSTTTVPRAEAIQAIQANERADGA